MVGFITEKNWKEAEQAFPGIRRYYQSLPGEKPATFLELEWRYLDEVGNDARSPLFKKAAFSRLGIGPNR